MPALADLLALASALAENAAASAPLAQGIRQGRVDWLRIVEIANRHLVSAALWPALQRKGLIELAPADCRSYLAEIYRLNGLRNARLRAQTEEALVALAARGVTPALLKGSVWLFDGALDAGARMMADIDLLAPRRSFASATAALERLGYRVIGDGSGKQHALTLCRPGAPATIDLHRDLGPQRLLLAADDALRAAEPLPVPGLHVLRLSPQHRVLHNLINSEIVGPNYRLGELALRHLLDLDGLIRQHGDAIDWVMLQRQLAGQGVPCVLPAALLARERLLGAAPPGDVPVPLRARLHYRRCLLQLQWPTLRTGWRLWTGLVHPFDRIRLQYRYGDAARGGTMRRRLHHALRVTRRDGPAVVRRIGAIGVVR